METKVIKLDASKNIDSAVAEAQAVLAGGGLVGFPTETVYGLAGRVDVGEGLTRLSELKERPANKPFTLHIGSRSVLGQYVPRLSQKNQIFLRKAWPGPLTVIFELDKCQQEQVRERMSQSQIQALYYNNSIGIRLPDHLVAKKLLSRAGGAVVAPSANLAGSAAATCADDVLAQLAGKIELVLDSGPTRYGRASTIVRLSGGEMEVVREGVLDAGTIQRMRSVTILFVCTGNSCRSPMAVGFCRKELAEKLGCSVDQLEEKGYKIISAGSAAFDGASASPESIEVCREGQADISEHRSGALTAGLLNQADLIYVMDNSHLRAVERIAPDAANRTCLLAEDGEIGDPIGMPLERYRQCGQQIAAEVRKRLEEFF